MTVTPDMGKANDGSNYSDLNDRDRIPDIDDEVTQRFAKDGSGDSGPTRILYSKKTRPSVVNPNIYGTGGYFWNGPTVDPFNRAVTNSNAIRSHVQTMSDPLKNAFLKNFTDLVNTYGNTNNAGTLLSLAKSGFPADSEIVKQILQVDAEDSYENYSQGAPNSVNSPTAQLSLGGTPNGIPTIPKDERTLNEATDAYETPGENFWTPVEFLVRNSFAALTMPLEASQGAMRNVGEALTDEDGMDIGKAIAGVASFILPPVALLADRIYGDNEFSNPWEQTEFGQTLLSASGGAGFEAFNSLQGGLDVERAEKEVRIDPEMIPILESIETQDELNEVIYNYAKEKGYYAEAGWFIDETSVVGENQIEAAFNGWNIPGQNDEQIAWTLGRGVASNVLGPEDSAYNVMSGTIDAFASILGDPTIIGGKLGLVSKSVRGLSGLTRGADDAILIGKEARKQRQAVAVANRGLQDSAELTGRSQDEVFAMNLAEQTQVVQEANILRATNAAFDTAEKQSDLMGLAQTRARGTRSLDEIAVVDEIIDSGVTGVINDVDANRISIWERYLNTLNIGAKQGENPLRQDEYATFYKELSENSDNVDLHNLDIEEQLIQAKAGMLGDGSEYDQAAKYLDNLKLNASTKINPPGTVLTDQEVAQASARGVLTDQVIDLENYAAKGNNSSTANNASILTQIPSETPQIAMYAGVRSVVTWGGDAAPKLSPAAEIPTSAQRDRLWESASQLLENVESFRNAPSPNFSILAANFDSMLLPQLKIWAKESGIVLPKGSKKAAYQDALKAQQKLDIKKSKKKSTDGPIVDNSKESIDRTLDIREEIMNMMDDVDVGMLDNVEVGIGRYTFDEILAKFKVAGMQNAFFTALRGVDGDIDRVDGIIGNLVRTEDGVRTFSKAPNGGANGIQMGRHPSLVAYVEDAASVELAKKIKSANKKNPTLLDDPAVVEQIKNIVGSPSKIISLSGQTAENLARKKLTLESKHTEAVRTLRDNIDTSLVSVRGTQKNLNDEVTLINKNFEDPEKALRASIGYNAGMINSKTNGISLDEQGVRNFLFGIGVFGAAGNRVLEEISNVVSKTDAVKINLGKELDASDDAIKLSEKLESEAMGKLFILTNGKWDQATIAKVVESSVNGGGKEGLVSVLGPRLGIDVTKGSVSRTTKRLEDSDGKTVFRTARTTSSGKVARKLGQMPASKKVNLSDPDEIAQEIFVRARYAKLDEQFVSEQIGIVLRAAGTTAANGTSRNALADVYRKINEDLLKKITDEEGEAKGWIFKNWMGKDRGDEYFKALKDALDDSTNLWVGGALKGKNSGIAGRSQTAVGGSAVEPISKNANELTLAQKLRMNDDQIIENSENLTGPDLPKVNVKNESVVIDDFLIDTEIARGFVALPDAGEWSKYLNRVARTLGRFKSTETVYSIGKNLFDNFYRTSLLAFRVAYIARNSAEMQVRMFLNGHQSVYSDPITLVGMTFGNLYDARKVKKLSIERKRKSDQFLEQEGRKPTKIELDELAGPELTLEGSFAPFKDTVLGTRFETGLDAELAAANHVEDYFELMRMSHSLTDPRVYNNAVKTGWVNVAYDSPNFVSGWANELIMLQKSEMVSLVMQGPKGNSFGNTVATKENISNWLVTSKSDEAEDLRNVMIGADSQFEEVFDSVELTQLYLFDSANSVQNKIKKFTNNNVGIEEFVRTGVYRYGDNQSLVVGSFPKPQERVSKLSTVLRKEFPKEGGQSQAIAMREHMINQNVSVPWINKTQKKSASLSLLFDKFFEVANKIERIGTVGPEFRLSYWDRIAELAPSLNAKEVDRALAAARTTLSSIKRYNKNGSLDNIGSNHPAFAALEKAKRENSNGFMTLDELHSVAQEAGMKAVQGLFYDATRRNNTWNALRLIFPFGQAWGDTLLQWGRLGSKNKIQVYKAQKAFNAFNQDGSSAAYDFASGDNWYNAYGNYADGSAPWEKDAQGGFFYQDDFGSTNFSYPFLGRAMAQGVNAFNATMGRGSTGMSDVPISSPADSLNLAVGADSIFPGIGALGSMVTNQILPENEVMASFKRITQPFGSKDVLDGASPAWFSKTMGGLFFDPMNVLGEKHRNKAVGDAITILASNGNYPNFETNPQVKMQLENDAKSLSKALLFATGLLQSALPSSPQLELTGSSPNKDGKEEGMIYGVGFLNTLYRQYLVNNDYDSAAAREDFVKDYGASFLLATTGDWQGFAARPTSKALAWARMNPRVAQANEDEFPLFFPGGDSSDVASQEWLKKYGSNTKVRKTPDQLGDEFVSLLARVERERVNSAEVAGKITADEATAYRDEITERYLDTSSGNITVVDKTTKLEKLNSFMMDNRTVRTSSAGKTFEMAWKIRSDALNQVRSQSRDPRATLGSKKALPVYEWYLGKIKMLRESNVDFKLLAGYFEREFEK